MPGVAGLSEADPEQVQYLGLVAWAVGANFDFIRLMNRFMRTRSLDPLACTVSGFQQRLREQTGDPPHH
jgi:hypothetical protein